MIRQTSVNLTRYAAIIRFIRTHFLKYGKKGPKVRNNSELLSVDIFLKIINSLDCPQNYNSLILHRSLHEFENLDVKYS